MIKSTCLRQNIPDERRKQKFCDYSTICCFITLHEFSNCFNSSSVSFNSIICSIPFLPIIHGTPAWTFVCFFVQTYFSPLYSLQSERKIGNANTLIFLFCSAVYCKSQNQNSPTAQTVDFWLTLCSQNFKNLPIVFSPTISQYTI